MEARFEFDNLDLYIDMELELEADTNYYLPLFTSVTYWVFYTGYGSWSCY